MDDTRPQVWHTAPFEGIWTQIDLLADLRLNPRSTWYVNYTIVGLMTALVEGSIEAGLRMVVQDEIGRSASVSPLGQRLLARLDTDIQRARGGVSSWGSLYQIVSGSSLESQVGSVRMEDLRHLFNLRNASAGHGRYMNSVGPPPSARVPVAEPDPFEWESDTLRKVEQHLRKRGVWTDYPRPRPAGDHWDPPEPGSFFQNSSVDYYYAACLETLSALGYLSTVGSEPGLTQVLLADGHAA